MKPFPRRIYTSFDEFWADIRFILGNRKMIRRTMRGGLVSFPFRERLMLTVTEVNGCRYCSAYHAKEALRAGISEGSLDALLRGSIPEDTPEDEIPALVYARHWAETNAHPDPEMTQALRATYGEDRALGILLALRMIRVGNLSGNLLDYILYRLSCGRFGLREEDREFVV